MSQTQVHEKIVASVVLLEDAVQKYAAIIAGPMGHSAAGNDGYSSFIERLKGEGYPTLY